MSMLTIWFRGRLVAWTQYATQSGELGFGLPRGSLAFVWWRLRGYIGYTIYRPGRRD